MDYKVVDNVDNTIKLSLVCNVDDLSDIKKLLQKFNLKEDISDIEIWKFFQENEDARKYVLNTINLCIQKGGNVSTNLMIFVKRFPESVSSKKLQDSTLIDKDKSIGFARINSFKNFTMEDNKDYEYLVINSGTKVNCSLYDIKDETKCKNGVYFEKFYPEYLFYNDETYLRTEDKILLNKNNEDDKKIKDILSSSMVYKKLPSKYIYNLENLQMWVIVTKQGCPYCKKAKELLNEKNINYKEVDLLSDKDNILKETDFYTNNYRKVPMVFTYDIFIGGYTDLEKYLE